MRTAIAAFAAATSMLWGVAAKAADANETDHSRADFTGVFGPGNAPRWATNWRDIGEGHKLLQVTDLVTGQVRLLTPDGDSFVGGDYLAPSPPETTRYSISADRISICALNGGSCESAPRIPLRTQAFSFSNDGIDFQGEIWKPAQTGCYPAVVVAFGSENSDRHSLDPFPEALAAHGIAAVIFDKRGTGASGGDWQDAGIEDFAGDINAARKVTARDPEINAAEIGLLGFSEGGWIAPAAAAREPAAFVVSISGGAFTKGDSYMYKMRRRFEEQGLTGREFDAAIAKEQAMIDASTRAAREDRQATGFDKRIAYDPTEDWRKIGAPVLWIGGEWDVLEDIPASAAKMRQLLAATGNADHAVIVFAGANHGIFETASRKPSDFFKMTGVKRHPPGYWPLVLSWITERTDRNVGRQCHD